jgi:hypothetical protein
MSREIKKMTPVNENFLLRLSEEELEEVSEMQPKERVHV